MTPENLVSVSSLACACGVVVMLIPHPLATIIGLCIAGGGVVTFLGAMVWGEW